MDSVNEYTDDQMIEALNMVNQAARGFFWTPQELAVLTGLVNLRLPARKSNQLYLQAQVNKCRLRSAKAEWAKPVYFLANNGEVVPTEDLNQFEYDELNARRPDITDVAYSARAARMATSVGAEARHTEVCVCARKWGERDMLTPALLATP